MPEDTPNGPGKATEDDSTTEDVATQSALRYSPTEEAAHLSASQELKANANKLFANSAYSEAISAYDQALATCPNYLDYEVAVLNSNIAACHLKLQQWKDAVTSATKALDGLDRETGSLVGKTGEVAGKDQVIEIEGDAEEQLEQLREKDERKAKIESLRAKSLLRRAKASVGEGGWAQLAAAEKDYKVLAAMDILPAGDKRFVLQQLTLLPPMVKEAQEREVGEMMGKLKGLGNSLLKPFGLSTDMFQFTKDGDTGGYNMSFGNKD